LAEINSSSTPAAAQPGLRKAMRLSYLWALASATILGPWLVMANWWFSLTGPSLSLAFLVTMLLMIPVAFCYSELTAMLPYAGGSYNFIGHAFNSMVSFVFMWSQTISYYAVTTFNILATIWILQYMGVVPPTQEALILAGLGFAVLYAVLNWFKVELSAAIQFALFWLLFITGIIWNGLDLFLKPTFSTAYFADLFPFGMGGFMVAAGSMVTMYFGFEVVAHMSEEARFPSKKLAIPVIGSILTAATVYIITLTAMAGSAPLDWLVATPNMPAEIVYLVNGTTTWATIGWWGIVLGGIACALTCVDGFWLALSRLFYSLGQANLFPKIFEKLNRNSIPGVASIVVFIGLIPLIVFSGTSWISTLFIIMGITIAIVYVGACLSFIQLRRKHPEWKRPFKAPGGILMGVLGLIGSGFCVAATAYALTPTTIGGGNYAGWEGWGLTIGYMIVGIIVYFLMLNYRKSRKLESKLCPTPECEMELKHKTEPMKS
jgi:APA family basic amino acid/polyamine antiporter